ncbi:MAG: hypothetical protein KIT14_18020 [bacterium]|nr:hypothetical protein [bacterium]
MSDRNGAALRRRERCLKLAAIPHTIEAERRPSGTYYKLSVRESDAVAAHLALQMGGCGRSLKLQESQTSFNLGATLRDLGKAAWDEMVLVLGKLFDFFRDLAPLLLNGPRETAPPAAEPPARDGVRRNS